LHSCFETLCNSIPDTTMFNAVCEADVKLAVKAEMRKHKISYQEASAIVASRAMREMKGMYSGLNDELKNGMQKVVDVVDSNNFGIDARKIDPMLRRVAKQETHLNIHFEDCSSLARQCAKVQRQAVLVSKVDPMFRMVAEQEQHLNIHFEDCSSLARQCAEVRRRAGY
jgi:hypothetical protein